MGVLTYFAERDLVSGHSQGVQYTIETAFQETLGWNREIGYLEETLDDSTEYELDVLKKYYRLTSDLVTDADLGLWQEFFSSVSAREQLQVDLTGTVASPGTNLNAILHRGNFNPLRQGPNAYLFTFDVKLVP